MRLPPQLRLLLPLALSGAFIFSNASSATSPTLISPPVAFANAAPEDGWFLAAPYGDVKQKGPGGLEVTQRFTFANAKNLVSDFKGLVARILEHRFGTANLPVLYGHPDDVGWAMSNASADHTVYSRVEDMEARPEGLFVKLQAWAEGFAKLPKGLGISPRWIGLPNADNPNIFEPVKLLSIGLWPTPKIPGTSLVNADTDTPTPAAPLPVDPPVVDLAAQVAALTAQLTSLTQERDNLKAANEEMGRNWNAKWNEASVYRAALAAALGQTYVSFRNAITPAEEPALVASLVNTTTPAALDAILAPLRTKPTSLPAGHTAASLVNGRAANADAATAQATFKGKVAVLQATGLSYGDAWAKVRDSESTLFKTAYPNG